jgi:hypothetical protein
MRGSQAFGHVHIDTKRSYLRDLQRAAAELADKRANVNVPRGDNAVKGRVQYLEGFQGPELPNIWLLPRPWPAF